MAISNVAYLRALWPENFFVTRHFENLELKIINSKSHPNARVLTDWILGVFHALERKYVIKNCSLSLFLLINHLNIVSLSCVNSRFRFIWIRINQTMSLRHTNSI